MPLKYEGGLSAPLLAPEHVKVHRLPFDYAWYGLLFVVIMFVMLWTFEWLPPSYFLAWDAGGRVLFFNDYKIDTPGRFALSSFIVVSNTLISQVVGQTMGNYLTNCIADHKTPRAQLEGNDFSIHMTIQVFYLYSALAGAVRIFFMFSSFYFVLEQGIATMVVTYFVTRRRLMGKS